MSIAALLTETITVIRYTDTTDVYGNTVAGAETRTDYPGRLEQLSAQEMIVDRDTVITDWRAFLPADIDLRFNDRIEARGHLFEVVGLPNQHRTPSGPHHVEVHLRYVV